MENKSVIKLPSPSGIPGLAVIEDTIQGDAESSSVLVLAAGVVLPSSSLHP